MCLGGVRAQVLPVTRPGTLAQVIRIQPGWGCGWGCVGGRVTEADTSTGQKEIQEESRRHKETKQGMESEKSSPEGRWDGKTEMERGER